MLWPSYPEKTNIYLNTSNEENTSIFDIKIPDGVLKCQEYEDFYLNIVQFNTFHNFYHVNEGYNNNFNIIIDDGYTINCRIPEGNISISTIKDYINKTQEINQYIKVVYSLNKNTFEFQKMTTNKIQIDIINAHGLLGFNRDKKIIELPCISEIPVNVMAITNIFLHLESGFDLRLNDGNLDNHSNKTVKSNAIILALPINQIYNNMIVYNNEDSGNSFYFRCNKQETISNLCISIRDQYDQIIPNFPKCHLILQFSKRLNNNPYLSLLEKIQDHIYKLLLLIRGYFLDL